MSLAADFCLRPFNWLGMAGSTSLIMTASAVVEMRHKALLPRQHVLPLSALPLRNVCVNRKEQGRQLIEVGVLGRVFIA